MNNRETKPDFRVIIAGGRDFNDYEQLKRKCDDLLYQRKITNRIVVVSGAAQGADRLGERYARERGYAIDSHPADWNTHGKSAGFIRNSEMANSANALIAFWDGKSHGTKQMIDTANAKGLDVRVIPYSPMNIQQRNDTKIEKLRQQTSQYAIEHITGKGMHTGIAWFRDSFNEYCEAMGANEFNPDDIGFDIDDLVENLKKTPWVTEIAGKPANQRTAADIDRVVNDFICEHWLMQPVEVTTKDVADVLKVADPLSHRHLVGQKVAIDCIHALNQEQLHRLDDILRDLEKNPSLSMSRGLGR